MAKREIKGTEFTRCDAFWQPEDTGEQFTGVLVDVNENMTDTLSNKPRPLYIFMSLEAKGEKPTLMVPKNADGPQAGKAIPNHKGLIIGVNDTYDLAMKIGQNLNDCLGHEITILFLEKQDFKKKGGGTRTLKKFKVMIDDEPNKEYAGRVVRRNMALPSAQGAEDTPDGTP